MNSCNLKEGDIIQQLDKYNVLTDHSNTILFSECMDCCCLETFNGQLQLKERKYYTKNQTSPIYLPVLLCILMWVQGVKDQMELPMSEQINPQKIDMHLYYQGVESGVPSVTGLKIIQGSSMGFHQSDIYKSGFHHFLFLQFVLSLGYFGYGIECCRIVLLLT